MLSITKIRAAEPGAGSGYARYLEGPTAERGPGFAEYARGDGAEGPPPFWACKGPALLGLDGIAEAEQVERMAKGLHPITGAPLVRSAGGRHVQGLDLTFSAPKDVSAVFAGADPSTRAAIVDCVQQSARAALAFAESNAATRHGKDGRIKRAAQAVAAACFTHFSSRAGDPQLHIHSLMFNLGKREGAGEWSALELRTQFEAKMATGILFRAELASRLRGLGFDVVPAGPYFSIRGIDERQRAALSTRGAEIARRMRETGSEGQAARDAAALETRGAKAEPPLRELLAGFEARAAELGIDAAAVAAMRAPRIAQPEEAFEIDRDKLLEDLLASRSCATSQDALALICERAMGRWGAAECLAELDALMRHENTIQLGRTELLAEVFTSKATRDLEAEIDRRAREGAADARHRLDPRRIEERFEELEARLSAQLGVAVSLSQQRDAALHVACETGAAALVVGWAGAGKTTMLKALGEAYAAAGTRVVGCCQSAAAAQNLEREAGIRSRTVASLLWEASQGRSAIPRGAVVVLDEAGMVGSKEFSMLQAAAIDAGAKLVCVGDPRQLQPIDAGGIFRSLAARLGAAEISNIQRQRTDFEPLLSWLAARGSISADARAALAATPEDARMSALEGLCALDPKLSRAFAKWRGRFDFEWMREAVELFATGSARAALDLLDSKGRLRLAAGRAEAMEAMLSDWARDKTALERKAMVAGTRLEVDELNRMARANLATRGLVDDAAGLDAEIERRDGSREARRFAPGDRVVFTLNDRGLGLANGATATIREIVREGSRAWLRAELDDPNGRGERGVDVPVSFARFDHAYCLTCHKAQGRTFDSAYALANPAMLDREWTYVAASRSRFATTVYADGSALATPDPETHQAGARPTRDKAIDALAARMSRSRAKGTSLDYDDAPPAAEPSRGGPILDWRRHAASSAKTAEMLRRAGGAALEALLGRARSGARTAAPTPGELAAAHGMEIAEREL